MGPGGVYLTRSTYSLVLVSIFGAPTPPNDFQHRAWRFIRPTASYFTRSTYSLVRVSIFILSPMLMNGGTFTMRPVDKVAGL